MLARIYLAVSDLNLDSLPNPGANASAIRTIITIVIATTAALSILFVVIGGFRYIVGQGESQAVTKAKATILYALIGLVVAMIAQFIVSFVAKGL